MNDEKGLTYVATIILVILIFHFEIELILFLQQKYKIKEVKQLKQICWQYRERRKWLQKKKKR